MFCPLAVEWGTVGEWAAAGGTFLAVLVALWLGRSQDRRIESQRRAEAAVVAQVVRPDVLDAIDKIGPILQWDENEQFAMLLVPDVLAERCNLVGGIYTGNLERDMIRLAALPGDLNMRTASVLPRVQRLQRLLWRTHEQAQEDGSDELMRDSVAYASTLVRDLQRIEAELAALKPH